MTLLYWTARAGRELNERKIWEWRQMFMDDHPQKPVVMTIMGVDWRDLIWAISITASIGVILLTMLLYVLFVMVFIEKVLSGERSWGIAGRRSTIDFCYAIWMMAVLIVIMFVLVKLGVLGVFFVIYDCIEDLSEYALDSVAVGVGYS
ncbi:hypothetical protein BGZ65_001729 [Modicella reniformis]|uniref:Uncharacterized protein n=1 Tax=Modicella reniformis TaxID=1440133 RepID=A0A9P6SUI6_9FUNG|nr:hypothetical protein BGZ65_001729 [Modicella reniformis]